MYTSQQTINRKKPIAKAIVVGLTLVCGGVHATLEEIVVTAQKREQGANDVGITLNAFTADQLANYGVARADDLEAMVPGLTVTQTQSAGAPVYTIRGVGFADFTTSATSTVGIYNDGVSIPFPVMTRGVLFDVARVEVLKGPQGDLYGRNTTAGQINFVSNKPTEAFEAAVSLGYDNYGVADIEGYVSGALGDTVQGRLALKSVSSSEGWQESVSRLGDELGERDELALRAMVNIDINESASLLVSARYFDNQSDGLAVTATSIGGAGVSVFDAEDADWTQTHRPRNNNQTTGVSATLNWDLGAIALTSITAFDSFERDGAQFDTSGAGYEDADITNTTDIDVFSQEIRLESIAGEGLFWTAGLFFSDDDIDENYLMEFRDSFGLTGESRYTQEGESVAIFGHVEVPVAQDTRLIVGGRYTEEEKSWNGCTYDTGDGLMAGFYNDGIYPGFIEGLFPGADPIALGGCAVFNDVAGTANVGQFAPFSDTMETEEAMWKVTLDHKPSEQVLIYGTIATGFKSGGYNGAIALSHQMLQPYDKEELISYELGVKSTLLDGTVQLNMAAFYYDYSDKQEPMQFISPVGGVVGFTNVPETEVLGAELELSWELAEGLRWDLGVAWLDSEIEKFTANCPAGLLGSPVALPEGCPTESSFGDVLTYDASGVELNNAPEWQVSSSMSYGWQLSDQLAMQLALDASYKSDNIGSQAAPDSSARRLAFSGYLPDYTLVNARLGVSEIGGVWNVSLWARNITDEYYWHSTGSSNSTTTRINGMPRSYGVTASYTF